MEREEFCTLARQLREGILALSRRFLKDEADAEDNMQDTLLRLWTIREKLDEVNSVQALSYAICKNLCVSKLRQRRIIPMELNEEIRLISAHDSQWMLEEKENALWLEERIAELPSSQMQILRMSQQDELENSQIAEILGISETTVRTALCKARKNLLEKMMKREAEQLKAVEL
jgi:RNA polymerase sigma-70 factor (ECF subfamily)